jgi:hypothetical protein
MKNTQAQILWLFAHFELRAKAIKDNHKVSVDQATVN